MASKQSKVITQDKEVKPVFIRAMSVDTWRRVRSAAALAEMTIGEWCEARLREAVKSASRKGEVA